MAENEARESGSEPVVLAQDADHVRVLTMNRPDKLNAFNTALFAGLADAMEAAAADNEVRVVVLTGAGRAFTAGADLTDMGRARTERGLGPALTRPAACSRQPRASPSRLWRR